MKTFKSLFLIVFFIQSSWFIYEYQNKNRYVHIKSYAIFDTKDAKLYVFGEGKIAIIDYKEKSYTSENIKKPTN
jgi:hypothetical protein